MVPENKFGLMLGLSIAETICCFPITGIIGIILSILANNAYTQGNYEGYESNAKAVKITLIIGLVIALITAMIVILIYGAVIITAISAVLHEGAVIVPTSTFLSALAGSIQ